VIALMSAPHAHPPDSAKAYGYGLSLTEDRGIALLEHGGSRLGYGSHIRMAPAQRVGIIVVTNRSGASLPKAIERATEMLLPLGPKTAAATRTSITMGETEMAHYAGIYTSGESRVELLMHDGRLYSRIDREMAPVTKLGEHRFAVEAGRGFLLVANAGGEIEYLCIGGRALRKTK
jgi:CubicO group peptidase (beta-lactamase class C family)